MESSSQDPSSTAESHTAASEAKVCGICETSQPKYKCPRCYLPYCSVACNKKHRENHPPDAVPEPSVPKSSEVKPLQQASEPADPNNPFAVLESSAQLRMLFEKYPNLPDQLLRIHTATLPPAAGPGHSAGIPASMLRGNPKKDSWNQDVGIQNGKKALRKARKAGGDDGEAIREYSELVLHILNKEGSAGDVTKILRQQAAHEDTKFIEQLMAQERG